MGDSQISRRSGPRVRGGLLTLLGLVLALGGCRQLACDDNPDVCPWTSGAYRLEVPPRFPRSGGALMVRRLSGEFVAGATLRVRLASVPPAQATRDFTLVPPPNAPFGDHFVLPREAWLRLFGDEPSAFDIAELRAAFTNAYWPVGFQLFFSDALLNTMFGPDATQHAVPGSYPGYFQGLIERGLLRDDARNNPFLQHIFLGHYMDREACVPPFLKPSSCIPGRPSPRAASWQASRASSRTCRTCMSTTS